MLSVVFSTWNRARILAGVLAAYRDVECPLGGWRLIVVDNGSSDDTQNVIAEYEQVLPLVCEVESTRGKNAALNKGLTRLAGDLTIFTDDDVFPHKGWLVEMRKAADRYPEYAVFGGVVRPRWEIPPDEQLLACVPTSPCFALTPSTLREGPIGPEFVFGPNMAIRTAVFGRGGYRFNPEIGPRGYSYPMGSETELVRRLIKDGWQAWHCQHAIVEHLIQAHQLQRPWIFSRAVRFGRGQQRLQGREDLDACPSWFGVPRYLVREILEAGARILGARVTGNQGARLRAQWNFNYRIGRAIECRALAAETMKGSRFGGMASFR